MLRYVPEGDNSVDADSEALARYLYETDGSLGAIARLTRRLEARSDDALARGAAERLGKGLERLERTVDSEWRRWALGAPSRTFVAQPTRSSVGSTAGRRTSTATTAS